MEEIKKLSNTIVNYSLKLKEKEKILITSYPECLDLILALIEDINKVGAIPFVNMKNDIVNAKLLEVTNDNRVGLLKKIKQEEVENYDAFINIRYTTNDYEELNTNSEILKKIGEATIDSDNIRINKRKWVLLNYPSRLDAYKANMDTISYKNYALEVMNVNYEDMFERIKPLKELMEKTDKVRIVSPNTDITFSIKDMPIIPCTGTANIPDGEIYTAPIKTSVNGTITYNVKSPYNGFVFENVSFKFKDGKIIEANSNNNKKIEEILNTDEGARYIGEFSLGLNPKILYPMGDILYDEKIIGSIHFTPGAAYSDAYNGNNSSVHWDLVLIQREDYGGGEIYFDDVLIRKNGIFVLPELLHLNYHLK